MLLLYGAVLIAGIANAIQPGLTTQLARSLGQPFAAGLVSMLVGTSAMLVVGLVSGRMQLPSLQQVTATPWWAWFGGAVGTGLVIAQLFVAHRIGAAPFLGLLVTAGVVTSIALDHFGLVGFAVHAAGPLRLVGGALMIVGVVFVALS
ncbi:DMT family transporter [Methylobacterium sp. Leaf118]|uniref:DMT family transporter n=1 Tax=Methylobacterium sp. Leaf118 TaxID=2876562 RepID=UPI001E51BF32|nr:DMT family transporter [Methylobacterium sp. Leaf118]